MDVIDRYFRTLRILLPTDQQDDIIRELSEEVQSQVAEKEAALGRPLNTDEHAAIIGQYGHPLLTAARYRPQRHLIGPVVFPYYWIVLRIALVLVAIGHVLGAAVLLAGDTSAAQIGQLVETAIGTALKVAAWVTALAAAADFCLARSRVFEKWNPLVSSPQPQQARRVVATALASVPRVHHKSPLAGPWQIRTTEPSTTHLVIGVVVGVWWLAGLRFPYLFFGSGAAVLEWGPAMDRLYPVLVVAQLAMLVEQLTKYTRPDKTHLFQMARFVWLTTGLSLIYLVATSDQQWMVWSTESAARAHAIVMRFWGREVSLSEFVNSVWSIVFITVAAASAWGVLRSLFRRLRGTPMTAHA